MTSARDQLEAQAFRRRRLVDAVFSSDGDLDGGSPAPVRALAVGTLLAVLVVVAAVLIGVSRPEGDPAGERHGGTTPAAGR
jgi:hypothetical protein